MPVCVGRGFVDRKQLDSVGLRPAKIQGVEEAGGRACAVCRVGVEDGHRIVDLGRCDEGLAVIVARDEVVGDELVRVVRKGSERSRGG